MSGKAFQDIDQHNCFWFGNRANKQLWYFKDGWNAVAVKEGYQGILLKIILRYLTSVKVEDMEKLGKTISGQILEYIIPNRLNL